MGWSPVVPNSNSESTTIPAPKKKPGRPPKIPAVGEPAAKKLAAKKPATKKPIKKPTAKTPVAGNLPANNNKGLAAAAPKRGPGRPRKIVPKDPEGVEDSGDKEKTSRAEDKQLVEGEEIGGVEGEEIGGVEGGGVSNVDGEEAGETVTEREANKNNESEERGGEADTDAEVGESNTQNELRVKSGRQVKKSRIILEEEENQRVVTHANNLALARRQLKQAWKVFEADHPPLYVSYFKSLPNLHFT